MFQDRNANDIVDCPADACEYHGTRAQVVSHIVKKNDPAHLEVRKNADLRYD